MYEGTWQIRPKGHASLNLHSRRQAQALLSASTPSTEPSSPSSPRYFAALGSGSGLQCGAALGAPLGVPAAVQMRHVYQRGLGGTASAGGGGMLPLLAPHLASALLSVHGAGGALRMTPKGGCSCKGGLE